MSKQLTLVLALFLCTQCSVDRTVLPLHEEEIETLERFERFQHENRLQISDDDEPGQKLWLCLSFVARENKEPLAKQTVNLYHTSSAGEYEPADPSDESTARLNGTALTNQSGELFVQTILPGDYGSSADNRHIHTTIDGAQPEAYDIHFQQYITPMGKNFVVGSDQHFLAELKQNEDSILVTFLTIEVKNPTSKVSLATPKIPDCEWCGATEAPHNTSWETTIADESEEGERLILEGKVYETDGQTPAENVIIYAYHTNDQGEYEKRGDETGNGVRHGHLRAWAKTNESGQYRFHTIKPAPYPSHAEPAHIHMTLLREDFEEYWINSTWFEGDELITPEMIANLNRTGGFSNIVELSRNNENVWVGKRDIILNPPE